MLSGKSTGNTSAAQNHTNGNNEVCSYLHDWIGMHMHMLILMFQILSKELCQMLMQLCTYMLIHAQVWTHISTRRLSAFKK